MMAAADKTAPREDVVVGCDPSKACLLLSWLVSWLRRGEEEPKSTKKGPIGHISEDPQYKM